MSSVRNVAVLVGSLRKASLNRKVATQLAVLAPASLKLEIVEIGDLALYSEDTDGASVPAAWTTFRQRVKAADAVLFVTPEYNRSVPGVLKNAIDVGSRPYGQSCWDGKPGAVVSVSPGAIGGVGGHPPPPRTPGFPPVPCPSPPPAPILRARRGICCPRPTGP